MTFKDIFDNIKLNKLTLKVGITILYISKSDLLTQTHITYGQLYRWKRLGLIPEEWFIKKITYTGQITVFPSPQALTRIQDILRLKEKYSLSTVYRLLTPNIAGIVFKPETVYEFEEMDNNLIDLFEEMLLNDNYTYSDVLIMLIVSDFNKQENLNDSEMKVLIKELSNLKNNINTNAYVITLAEYKEEYFIIITKVNSDLITDGRFRITARYYLEELYGLIRNKYRKSIYKDPEDLLKEALDEIDKEYKNKNGG